MIGKTLKGASFLGLFKYLLAKDMPDHEDARIIGGTIQIPGDVHDGTAGELAEVYEGIRLLAPGRRDVVYHQMLRPPPGEGERLSDETWAQIAKDHARAMGYAGGQYTVFRHNDHVHIVANRVLFSGKVVSDSYDFARAERSVRAIESKYGLTQVKSSHLLEPEEAMEHERAPTQAEKALKNKGDVSVRELIQDRVLAALGSAETFSEFAEELHKRGVLVRPNVQSTGRLAGLSFVLTARPEFAFSGTSLGHKFRLGNLTKAGLDYDPVRDREAVERALQRCDEMEAPQTPPTHESQNASRPLPTDTEAPERQEELLQPLADPKAARQHLEALGSPVVLAARTRTGDVKEFATVDHQSIGAWRRRLRRRCALGEEIVVRPAQDGPLLVLPQLRQGDRMTLDKLGIEPFLVVVRESERHDAWLRVTGDESAADELRARLRDINLGPSTGRMAWGSLAGYRPDPVYKGTSTTRRIINRIALIADSVVDVSQDILERLRRLAEGPKKQKAPDASCVAPRRPDEKGRSR